MKYWEVIANKLSATGAPFAFLVGKRLTWYAPARMQQYIRSCTV
jgi:hypothetical protein